MDIKNLCGSFAKEPKGDTGRVHGRAQRSPKETQDRYMGEPKGAQRSPKETQDWYMGAQRSPKETQDRYMGEPKGDTGQVHGSPKEPKGDTGLDMGPSSMPSVPLMVGCGVSCSALIILLLIYAAFWRYIRSERSIILVNFCLSILASNMLILVGQSQTLSKVNMLIGIVVFNKLMSRDGISDKSKKKRAGASLWSSCVVLPLLALTWMSAVLAITDRRSTLFQVLFAVFDSVQGFVIITIHCVMRREVQDAVRCRMGVCKDDSENSPDSCKNGQVQIMRKRVRYSELDFESDSSQTVTTTTGIHVHKDELTYKCMRFLITYNPTNTTLNKFTELRTPPPRACPLYMFDWPFRDGAPPCTRFVDDWLKLLKTKFREQPGCCMAVHCVAGLGSVIEPGRGRGPPVLTGEGNEYDFS
ncbi:hypothetical protein NHX12_023316 [Muraenolepis orangiensis]|uniref:G-protein coupled receptors family 2 profile 2 domain-containing protein n=1 Tax=Muraenolepis orangiensis TaxID=630683 RepID=A0A9Q0ITN4_9TELE|nr:hypothetical protein NHX12_023316 [Muraenolepis orangiensis]